MQPGINQEGGEKVRKAIGGGTEELSPSAAATLLGIPESPADCR